MEIKSVPVRQSERGQSLVELAFSLVVLLILVSGVFDGARALAMYLSLRDGAQEGALYASVNPSDTAGIRARVLDASTMLSSVSSDLVITITPTVSGKFCMGYTGNYPHGIQVKLDYPNFPLTMPFIGAIVGREGTNTLAITTSVIDTIITPSCH